IVAAIGVAALAAIGWRRLPDWRDDKSLWEASVRVDGRNPFAWANLGALVEAEGDRDQAEAYYKRALQNLPNVELARPLLVKLIASCESKRDAAGARYWRQKLATVPK